MNEFPNPGTNLAVTFAQDVIEPENVALKKALKILGCWRDLMKTEELAHQPHIGASGELQPLKSVHRAEFRRKDPGKRLDPSASRADERAVNVEKDQAHHLAKTSRIKNRGQ